MNNLGIIEVMGIGDGAAAGGDAWSAPGFPLAPAQPPVPALPGVGKPTVAGAQGQRVVIGLLSDCSEPPPFQTS